MHAPGYIQAMYAVVSDIFERYKKVDNVLQDSRLDNKMTLAESNAYMHESVARHARRVKTAIDTRDARKPSVTPATLAMYENEKEVGYGPDYIFDNTMLQ